MNAHLQTLLTGIRNWAVGKFALASSLTSHTTDANVHVTTTEKNTWSGKQDVISDLTDIRSGAAAGATAIQTTAKGVKNGVASLDSNGKVPTLQLPSYVDDVVEGYYNGGKFYKEAAHTTEIAGESGKIYVDLHTNHTYRWSGSAFVQIKGDLVIGEGANDAFAGSRGKALETTVGDANSGLVKAVADNTSAISTLQTDVAAKYTKPTGGIPATDLAEAYITDGTYTTGAIYGRTTTGWAAITISGGIPEAPQAIGEAYARENGAWVRTYNKDQIDSQLGVLAEVANTGDEKAMLDEMMTNTAATYKDFLDSLG